MAREDTRTEQPTANAGRPDGGTSGKPAAESPASNNIFANTPGLVLGALISCALWGSAFPMIKIGNPLFGIATGDAASQILFAGIRFTISGILTIVAVSLVRRRPLCPRTGDDFRKALILSLFQTAGQYALFYPGVSRSSGITASIIEASNVFITVFIAALVFRSERLTSRKLLGCAAGFAGVVLVNIGASSVGDTPLGSMLVLASTVCAGTSACLTQRYAADHDPVMLSGWQFLMGGVTLVCAGWLAGGHVAPSGPEALGVLLYLGFLSAAAYGLWSVLLSHNPVSRVTVFGFMNPVFGVALSALLLRESPAAGPVRLVAALVLISLGVIVVNRAPTTEA